MPSDETNRREGFFRILHLSDTHLTAGGVDQDGARASESLQLLLEALSDLDDVHLVVHTGDISDDGSVDGSLRVRQAIEGFARGRAIPHIYTSGNHDDPASFVEVFGSGHLDPHARLRSGIAVLDARGAMSVVSGFRVITLRSSVPGMVHGHLTRSQLGWLAQVLAAPADNPYGSLLALHHPPLTVDRHPMRSWLLDNADELEDAVAGSDLRAILCGHVHHQMAGSLGGVPVFAAPGIVSRIDLSAPRDQLRGVVGAGASIVELATHNPSVVAYALASPDPATGQVLYQRPAPS